MSSVLVTGGERSTRAAWLRDLPKAVRSEARLLTIDLGLPLAGPPGAVSLLRFGTGRFVLERVEALCTLDAARFRLPLFLAAKRASEEGGSGTLVIEAPKITRGMAFSEILAALIEGFSVKTAFLLGGAPDAREELRARGVEVTETEAQRSDAPFDREVERTAVWNEFLESAEEVELSLREIAVFGAPPPRTASEAWVGRQVAYLGARGETIAFGEILSLEESVLKARVRRFAEARPRVLLVRDARRDPEGRLSTDRIHPAPGRTVLTESGSDLRARSRSTSTSSELRPPIQSLSSVKALLVNGIFGDPLLHLRLRHRKRSLLFDLGDAVRLPARIAHQVSDVFISHAHFDHIGGFLWLLRSSIGSPRPRSLYGPPGLCEHIEGMISGIHWDRIGDRGPVFEVLEVHPERLERFRLQAGRNGREALEARELRGNVVLEEAEFRVRAATLDHGIPVLAFAFEETTAMNVRTDRLENAGLPPGPWLSELKRLVLENRGDDLVLLPGGGSRTASDLGAELLEPHPGQKLVYATDLDDHDENHRALTALAADARVLFCEASFVEEDRELARATQHLTARACGRIAASARVSKLVPFHFSKRYEHDPEKVYREVLETFSRTVVAS